MYATRNADLHWQRPNGCTNTATCVEVALLPEGGMAVRDGKNPQGPVLRFAADEWAAFLSAAKSGEFDPHPAD